MVTDRPKTPAAHPSGGVIHYNDDSPNESSDEEVYRTPEHSLASYDEYRRNYLPRSTNTVDESPYYTVNSPRPIENQITDYKTYQPGYKIGVFGRKINYGGIDEQVPVNKEVPGAYLSQQYNDTYEPTPALMQHQKSPPPPYVKTRRRELIRSVHNDQPTTQVVGEMTNGEFHSSSC